MASLVFVGLVLMISASGFGQRDDAGLENWKTTAAEQAMAGVWTAPNLKCNDNQGDDKDSGTCEMILSGLTELLNLDKSSSTTPSASTTTAAPTSTTTEFDPSTVNDSRVAEQHFRQFFMSKMAKFGMEQDNRNQLCCSLLGFELLRDRCCSQLRRFCEATAGRPDGCQCPSVMSVENPRPLAATGADGRPCTFTNWIMGTGGANDNGTQGESSSGFTAMLKRAWNWLKSAFSGSSNK